MSLMVLFETLYIKKGMLVVRKVAVPQIPDSASDDIRHLGTYQCSFGTVQMKRCATGSYEAMYSCISSGTDGFSHGIFEWRLLRNSRGRVVKSEDAVVGLEVSPRGNLWPRRHRSLCLYFPLSSVASNPGLDCGTGGGRIEGEDCAHQSIAPFRVSCLQTSEY